MGQSDYYIRAVNPVEGSSIYIKKYGEKKKQSESETEQKKEESKKRNSGQIFSIKEEKEEHSNTMRTERSLQYHMEFMIWMGRKKSEILKG